jgi:putative addiction module killer protein
LPNGKEPFIEWLDSLDYQTQAILAARIERVKLGNFGNCESVGIGVSELKIFYGPGYRIYFAKVGNRLILFLLGGDKGTQKQDIKRAQRYWVDYQGEKRG